MTLPLIIEPLTLHTHLYDPRIRLVDLCSVDAYRAGHLPSAAHLPTAQLISGEKPAVGALPPPAQLAAALSAIGLTPDTHLVCYDDEGGPWAGRLAWTLDVIGHRHYSVLNGGKTAWRADGLPLTTDIPVIARSTVTVHYDSRFFATADELRQRTQDPNLLVWDARSRDEYTGVKAFSARGGHIPGAQHGEWTTLLDPARGLRLRTDLAQYLQQQGITPDRDIVTHCQTHRRSGLTYLAAKSLGYPRVRAYAGSWAEWGNRTDLPVHTGDSP